MVKESSLVNQWLWEFHRVHPQWRRVRLGVMPSHELGRMYMVLLRWADAIFIEDQTVNIVEAKLRPKADAIGQLLLYRDLFQVTPEFADYKHYTIKLIFLTTMMDLAIANLCSKQGIDYVVYEPVENWYPKLAK